MLTFPDTEKLEDQQTKDPREKYLTSLFQEKTPSSLIGLQFWGQEGWGREGNSKTFDSAKNLLFFVHFLLKLLRISCVSQGC